jgi:hypothetical protein
MKLVVTGPERYQFPLLQLTEDPLLQAVPVKRIVRRSIRKRYCTMVEKELLVSTVGRYAHALGTVRIVTPTVGPVSISGQAGGG